MSAPDPPSHYIHGTDPGEQERLSLLNGLLNSASLRAMRLQPGDRVLDVGSGLGQLTRAMARAVGDAGTVVGIEREAAQIATAERAADLEGEAGLVDFRAGDLAVAPLAAEEWGSFDVVHARFVLEHLRDPAAAVATMVRAARPGGRVILEDDDHDLLRLWPPAPAVERLWRAYIASYEYLGNDPYVGRRLAELLARAGAPPRRTDMLFFGACSGSPVFEQMVENFAGLLRGARGAIVAASELEADQVDEAVEALMRWAREPGSALWYSTCWAEGSLASPAEAATQGGQSRASSAPLLGERRISPLEFLVESARDLGSTLELDEIFQKIADRVRLLLDAHLFCVMLWNEDARRLEHSYSLKFGRHVPQEGGFPLGYGLSGTAAEEMRPVRVANVLRDERYVRFRHAEVEVRSELAVPLITDGRLVGVLDLESTEYDAFSHEHEQVLSALGAHIAAALENARLYREVRSKEERFERELETARQIQRGLLPVAVPKVEGLDFAMGQEVARELSGDFYDVLPVDGGVVLALGDVAGKGTAAALLASVAVGALRAQVGRSDVGPRELLAALNRQLRGLDLAHRLVAMALVRVDRDGRRLRLSNAGLPPPLLWREGALEPIDLPAVPLGGLEESRYRERVIELQDGDVLVMASDGIEEALDDAGEPFGSEGIARVLATRAAEPARLVADEIVRAATAHLGPLARSDDRTVVVLRAVSVHPSEVER